MNYYTDFSDGPMVKSLRFHCSSCGFKPWLGTKILHGTWPKKRIITKIFNLPGAFLLVFWLMCLSPSLY